MQLYACIVLIKEGIYIAIYVLLDLGFIWLSQQGTVYVSFFFSRKSFSSKH